jgi:hypothetical protein
VVGCGGGSWPTPADQAAGQLQMCRSPTDTSALITWCVTSILCCITSGPGIAQTPDRRDDCTQFEKTWSAAEQSAWRGICTDGNAILSRPAAGFKLRELPAAEQDSVRIRTTFLSTILRQSPYREHVQTSGISIQGAVFTEPLVLSDLVIQGPLLLTNSYFSDTVEFNRIQFSASVSFVGSAFDETLSLHGSHVGSQLLVGGSDESTSTPRTEHPKAPIKSLQFTESEIAGDFHITDATFSEGIDISSLRVGGSLSLFRVIGHEVALYAGEIHRQLIVVDSTLAPREAEVARLGSTYSVLNLFSIRASQDVFLDRTDVLGTIDLDDSEIAGSIELTGARLSSIHARSATIKGEFGVGRNIPPPGRKPRDTTWTDKAVLDLSNATVGVIASPVSLSPPVEPDAQPVPKYWPAAVILSNLKTNGFSLEPLEGDISDNKVDWLLKWLRLQSPFVSQPYNQARTILAQGGDQAGAAKIGYATRDRELEQSIENCDVLNAGYLILSKLLIGYGYWMWLPIVWTAGFVTAGAYVFRHTNEARSAHMPYGISYSFDMFLPLIKLRQRHYDLDLETAWARYYFYVHKVFGWIIGSFILAGIAGFTK